MNILILTGSHRMRGNSNTLVEHFQKGAQEKGHSVVRFDCALKKVHGCIGCNKCNCDSPCIFEDDFMEVWEPLQKADLVVFASPMYYYAMSGQIKNVIDRFWSLDKLIHGGKKAVLILALGGTDIKTTSGVTESWRHTLDYLGWKDAGSVIATGVYEEGDVLKTDFPKQAYELGKRV